MKFKILFLLLLASFVVNGQDINLVPIVDTGLMNYNLALIYDKSDPFYEYRTANLPANIEYIANPNYVDPEVKRLIQGLKNDYQYQIDALKLRIEALENEAPECDCCQYALTYYEVGQNYEWIDEYEIPHQLTIPEIWIELPEACIGAKAIMFMLDFVLYLEYTEQDGWKIIKAVRASY